MLHLPPPLLLLIIYANIAQNIDLYRMKKCGYQHLVNMKARQERKSLRWFAANGELPDGVSPPAFVRVPWRWQLEKRYLLTFSCWIFSSSLWRLECVVCSIRAIYLSNNIALPTYCECRTARHVRNPVALFHFTWTRRDLRVPGQWRSIHCSCS